MSQTERIFKIVYWFTVLSISWEMCIGNQYLAVQWLTFINRCIIDRIDCDLNVNQSDEEFDKVLGDTIDSIYDASVNKG